MTRESVAKTKSRSSPLPVIGAVVAIILIAFYGWSQRSWLCKVGSATNDQSPPCGIYRAFCDYSPDYSGGNLAVICRAGTRSIQAVLKRHD